MADAVAVLLVDLAQFLLQLALLLVEVEKVLFDERFHIHLHVVGSDGVRFAPVHRQRRQVAEDALPSLRLTRYSIFSLFLRFLSLPLFLLLLLFFFFQLLLFQFFAIYLFFLLTIGPRSCLLYAAAEPSCSGLFLLLLPGFVSFGELLG